MSPKSAKSPQSLYAILVEYLKAKDLELTEEAEESTASFPVTTDSTEFVVYARADEDARHVIVHSVFRLRVPDLEREAVALYLTRANYGLGSGNFELDLDDGETRFKTSIDLGDTPLTPSLLEPLFGANIATVDLYAAGISAVVAGVLPEDAILLAEG